MIPRKVSRTINNGTCALGVVPGPIESLKQSKVQDYEIYGRVSWCAATPS